MLIGLFTSRALLSISLISFLAATCIHKNIFSQLKNFIKNPFLTGVTLLFLIPFISGLWSSNTSEWLQVVRTKLPLFFFPIAFAGKWKLTENQWRSIGFIFIALVFFGCCWSLWQYVENMQLMNKGYLRAQAIPTPLQNDHIRFSWMVTVAVALCFLLIEKIQQLKPGIFFSVLILFFTVYLHILSARTGLFCLYIFLFLIIIYWLLKNKNKKFSLFITLLLVMMPVAAWFFFPTFQNRIHYFNYDLSYIKNNTYLPGANDGNRLLSIKAGWNILKDNPSGVGAGDLKNETNSWYNENVPNMLEGDKFYPSNEWLIYGGFAGWIGFFLFMMIMLLPFFIKKMKNRFFWIVLNIIAAFSFIFDIGLEVQFGVFLYAFTVMWWYKWFRISEIRY